MFASSLQAVG